ncbi:10414_t:CDS:2, partial [Scutellospora calospora]
LIEVARKAQSYVELRQVGVIHLIYTYDVINESIEYKAIVQKIWNSEVSNIPAMKEIPSIGASSAKVSVLGPVVGEAIARLLLDSKPEEEIEVAAGRIKFVDFSTSNQQ